MFKKARQSVVFKSFIQGFFNRMLNMKSDKFLEKKRTCCKGEPKEARCVE